MLFSVNEAWIRTGIGRAGAVLRLHPAGSTLPIMVLSGGAIAFLLFSTVSIRVLHSTPASPEAASGPNPVATAGAVPITGSQGGVAGLGGSGNRQAIPPGLGGSSLATGPSLTGAGPNAASGSGNGTGQGGSGTSGGTGTGTSGGSGGGKHPQRRLVLEPGVAGSSRAVVLGAAARAQRDAAREQRDLPEGGTAGALPEGLAPARCSVPRN